MLQLPHPDSPVWVHVTKARVLTLEEPGRLMALPSFREALDLGRATLGERKEKKLRSTCLLTLRADGAVWLIRVTHSSWSKVWNFGDPTKRVTVKAPANMPKVDVVLKELGYKEWAAMMGAVAIGSGTSQTIATRSAIRWLRKNKANFNATFKG